MRDLSHISIPWTEANTPVLDEIEKEALRDFVPIIRKEMQSFLKLLLAMQKIQCVFSRWEQRLVFLPF